MPAVSNTSPILNLAVIGHLELLRRQFGEVVIPRAVYDELRPEEPLPGSDFIRQALREGWLLVVQVKEEHLARALRADLDAGEAEAIALAVETRAKTILLDEREARKTAKQMGLSVTGALGVLLKAKRDGTIASLRTEIQALKEKAGFRIHEDLVATLLDEAEEASESVR